jgi:hypothetical protein
MGSYRIESVLAVQERSYACSQTVCHVFKMKLFRWFDETVETVANFHLEGTHLIGFALSQPSRVNLLLDSSFFNLDSDF